MRNATAKPTISPNPASESAQAANCPIDGSAFGSTGQTGKRAKVRASARNTRTESGALRNPGTGRKRMNPLTRASTRANA